MASTRREKTRTLTKSDRAPELATPVEETAPVAVKRGRKAKPAEVETPPEVAISPQEALIVAKYTEHKIIPGSWRASGGREGWGHKVTVEICCTLCDAHRVLATSDLFHCRHCVQCGKDVKKARLATKKAKKAL